MGNFAVKETSNSESAEDINKNFSMTFRELYIGKHLGKREEYGRRIFCNDFVLFYSQNLGMDYKKEISSDFRHPMAFHQIKIG